jgi:hypothetical protein
MEPYGAGCEAGEGGTYPGPFDVSMNAVPRDVYRGLPRRRRGRSTEL